MRGSTDHQMRITGGRSKKIKFGETVKTTLVTDIFTSGAHTLGGHANIQRKQATEEGLLAGPEDPKAGHSSMEAALQTALHGDQETGRGSQWV